MSDAQRRRRERYDLALPVRLELVGSSAPPFLTHTINVSAGGVLCPLPSHCPALSEVRVSIDLPAGDGTLPPRLEMAAVVVWIDPESPAAEGGFLGGLAFINDDVALEERLARFLEAHVGASRG